MPTLTLGQPVTVSDPLLLIENNLAVGRHRFQLVVIDEAGLESEPAMLVVSVRGITRPVDTRPTETRPTDVFRPDVLERLRRRPDVTRVFRRPP